MKIKESQCLAKISDIALFQNLPGSAKEILHAILVEKEFRKGENVFTEGDEAEGFYVLCRGRVKVYKLSPDGKEQILHIVESKELLGAVSAFAGTPYPAHSEAMEKSAALFFPRAEFLEIIKKEPSIVMNMMANLAFRLQHFTRMIEDLSLKEVPGRLAAYLLYLSEKSGEEENLEIDISKGQLASLLGTIPETLSRILRKMSEQGVLEVKGRKIKLLKKGVLQDIVQGGKTGF
ncbi:MAG: Crp/Fnr family transcriptional regulator [Nitrospira sp.]|nr:Crp/Fnr family transcriptional regulator [bacterium]MBL7049494.1 Crp/Fnr family transcriptional regulator [Nitrospira sp.]